MCSPPISPQDDEIDALRAIYDEDFCKAEGAETSYSIHIRSEGGNLSLQLNVRTYMQMHAPCAMFDTDPVHCCRCQYQRTTHLSLHQLTSSS